MVACFCRLRTPDDELSATVKVALSFRYGIQFSVRNVGHAGAKPGCPAAGRWNVSRSGLEWNFNKRKEKAAKKSASQ